MNGILKKILVGICTLTFVFGAVACGGNGKKADDEAGDRFTLRVFNYKGGYGTEWLSAAKARYEELHKNDKIVVGDKEYTGVYVKLNPVKSTMESMVDNFSASDDVYFQERANYYTLIRKNIVEDITDVVTGVNPYEDKKTEEKLTAEQKDYYLIDGKYYGLPHYAGYYGITYNAELFDNNGYYFKKDYAYDPVDIESMFTKDKNDRTAGPDGISGTDDDGLPTTYDEFFTLCDYISQTGVYPMHWTGKHRNNYMTWLYNALVADAEGLDQMMLNYSFNGEATDLGTIKDGQFVFDAAPTTITEENGYELARQVGKYYALQFMSRLIKNQSYYNVNLAMNNDNHSHTDAQNYFITGDPQNKDYAMLSEGVWWESEATYVFSVSEKAKLGGKKDRRFAWMPFPKPTKELADLKAQKIANGEKGSTLTDVHNSLAFVRTGLDETTKKIAKDFLMFCNTDESLVEYTQITDTTKSLQYTLTEEQKSKMSPFGRSVITAQENSDIVYTYSSSKLYQNNQEELSTVYNYYPSTTSTGVKSHPVDTFYSDGMTPETYFNGLYVYNRDSRWGALIK